jgi:hypothetical protein
MRALWNLALLGSLVASAAYAETVESKELVIERQVPFLWNQVFGTIHDELRPGRIFQYTVPLALGQRMYVNVISPLKQAYLFVPGAEEFKEEKQRPVGVWHWQGRVAGQDKVVVQVWSEWNTDFILEVTRK